MRNLTTGPVGDRRGWTRSDARANPLPRRHRIVDAAMTSSPRRFTAGHRGNIVAVPAEVLA